MNIFVKSMIMGFRSLPFFPPPSPPPAGDIDFANLGDQGSHPLHPRRRGCRGWKSPRTAFLSLITSIILLTFAAPTQAQILPPDLQCTSGDTLFWQPPASLCGPFNSYQIYISQNAGGPFTLLAEITDPAETQYIHPNPTNDTLYFYMTSDLDCPGQQQLSSDTLDNLIPEPIVIRVVTVNGEDVYIDWEDAISPEVTGYLIFRQIGGNVDVIDTIYNATEYIDTLASPNSRSELYFILGLDECENNSIFINPHQTIYLEAENFSCDQSIELNWNLYQNWRNGIGEQHVWVSIDGGAYEEVATLEPGDDFFVLENVIDSAEYCIYLQAEEAMTGVLSNSNVVCLTTNIVEPIEVLDITNVTYQADNSIRVDWVWNENAEILAAEIQREFQAEPFTTIGNIPIQLPIPPGGSFVDPPGQINGGPISYQLITTDSCGATVTSTKGTTILLTAFATPQRINQLNWSPFGIENGTALSYDIYKTSGGLTTYLATVDGATTIYEDPVDVDNPFEEEACYYVIGKGGVNLSNGSNVAVQSRSNTTCIEQFASVFMPNAFAPSGINQEFRPVIAFGNDREYLFQIFNRYGQKVFETTNPSEGWDGSLNGKEQPGGVYVYYLRLVQPDGEAIELKGTLALLP
jgi:gliding motility-associated-like protein